MSKRAASAFLGCLLFIITTAEPASAAPGSQIYVIVGGSQEPAKSYTFTGWHQSSPCKTPYAAVKTYIRWYIREVRSSSVYITKIYMSVTPTRNSTWGGMELYDANTNWIKNSPYLGSVSANTTKSHTMTVERWMPISTGSPIQLYSYHGLNAKPDEPAVCFGDAASNNFLNRR